MPSLDECGKKNENGGILGIYTSSFSQDSPARGEE